MQISLSGTSCNERPRFDSWPHIRNAEGNWVFNGRLQMKLFRNNGDRVPAHIEAMAEIMTRTVAGFRRGGDAAQTQATAPAA